MTILCRHCQKNKATRPGLFCWRCYYTPGLTALYGVDRVKMRSGCDSPRPPDTTEESDMASKAQSLDAAATVLERVAANLRDPNVPDTATVTPAHGDFAAKFSPPFGFFIQKVTLNGVPMVVTVMPDTDAL